MIQTPSRSSCQFIERGYFWSLAIFALTLPVRPFFLQNILSYSTILFLIFALLRIIVCRDFDLKSRYRQLILFTAPFIWWGFGLLYSADIDRAFKALETKLVLILLPGFILMIHPVGREKLRKILHIYAIGVSVYLLLSYLLVLHQNYQYNEFKHVIIPFYLYHSLVHFIGIHATYMSIQVALAILIVFDGLLEHRLRSKSFVYHSIWLVFLLFALISLTTKMVTLALLIAGITYVLRKTGKKSIRILAPVMIVIILSGMFFSGHHWFQKRMFSIDKQLEGDFSKDPENENGFWGSFNMRYALSVCAWDVISENVILGTGIGDGKAERLRSYESRKFQFALNRGFNEHNQYLNIWLTSGLIGLIIFLLLLGIPFFTAWTYNDALYLGFIVLVGIAFLSENYLSRQIGVAFFAFFHALLWQHRSETAQTIPPKTM